MITYDDIIFFYKDKKNIPGIRCDDNCNKLAKTFYNISKGKVKGLDDDIFYANEIIRRMNSGTLTELVTFKYFTEEEAYTLIKSGYENVETIKSINPSQKWHLYVSYIAYQEVAEKLDFKTKVKKVSGKKFDTEPFYLGKNIRQKEFKKWMIEEATLNKNSK
jgi:hypothetical protein